MAEDEMASDVNKMPEAPHWGLGRSVETKSFASDGRSSFDIDNYHLPIRGSMSSQDQGVGNVMRMSASGLEQPLGDPARDAGFASIALYQDMVCPSQSPYKRLSLSGPDVL